MRRLPLLLLLMAALLAGCAPDPPTEPADGAAADTLRVEGTLTYRERVQLIPGSTGAVTLRRADDPEAPPLADTTFLADGVPVPFVLRVPAAAVDTAAAYVVTARPAFPAGRLVWETPQPAPVLTRGAPRRVELILYQQEVAPTPAGPEPWREARQRGVVFRALGQEPPWMLDVHGSLRAPERMTFTTDYGEHRVSFTEIVHDTDGDGNPRLRGEARGHSIEVGVEDGRCYDPMSGEAFEATVRVLFDGESFSGCGRSLT